MKLSYKNRGRMFYEPTNCYLLYSDCADRYIKALNILCAGPYMHGIAQIGKTNSLFYPTIDMVEKLALAKGLLKDEAEQDEAYWEQFREMLSDLTLGSIFRCWGLCENVYQMDSDALTAILSAPLPDRLCLWQLLNRFREYCIYISFDWQEDGFPLCDSETKAPVRGVFVQLDGSLEPDREVFLKLFYLIDPAGGNNWLDQLCLSDDGMFGGIGRVVESLKKTDAENNASASAAAGDSDASFLYEQLIKVLAYILADNHDVKLNGKEIKWSDRDSMRPKATKDKGVYRFIDKEQLNAYTAGEKLGKQVRLKLDSGAKTESIKGHFTVEVTPSMKPGEDILRFALD